MKVFILAGIFLVAFLDSFFTVGQVQRGVPLSGTDAPYGYYEYLPADYSTTSEYPLVIYLHGLGEIGDGEKDLYKLKVHGPHKLIEAGTDFPAVILTPQSVSWWDIDKIGAFVDWAFRNYAIDTTRLYVTGNSMGGGGTWLFAARFPEYPAAIVPICGAADTVNTANLAEIPVWAFHSLGDPVVDVKLTFEWIAGIKAAGGDPKATFYQNDLHDSWTETYENEEVWEWMFAQKKGGYPLSVFNESGDTSIFPNPFSDQITVQSDQEVRAVRLLDVQGRLQQELPAVSGSNNIHIEIGSVLQPGVYLLELQLGEDSIRRYRIRKR